MKEIKELSEIPLHLYLGCEVQIKGHPNGILGAVGIQDGVLVIVKWSHEDPLKREWSHADVKEIKLRLRRLSSMTEAEGLEIVKCCYKHIYQIDTEFRLVDTRFIESEGAGFIVEATEFGDRIGLSIDKNRICFSVNGSEMLIPTFHLTADLLFKGFWLFSNDAFEKGLIIDADAKQ